MHALFKSQLSADEMPNLELQLRIQMGHAPEGMNVAHYQTAKLDVRENKRLVRSKNIILRTLICFL